ncbi:MAG: hypothetical protein EAZ92_17085, partial [Candidatus Kapaibacterium sp.]
MVERKAVPPIIATDMSSKLSSQLAQIEEMQELVNDFIHESLANLERTEQLVESLGTDDIWLIEQNIRVLFRTFHSIKGVAGFLQFTVLQALTHEAETLLDGIRKRPTRQSEAVLQAIYRAFDGIRAIIRAVELHKTDVSTHELAESVIAHIQQFILPNERIDLDGNVVPQQTMFASAGKLSVVEPNSSTPLPATPEELGASEIDQLHSKTKLLIEELQQLVELEKTNAKRPDFLEKFTEEAQERTEQINTLISSLMADSRLQADAPPMTIAQSALVFSDMMAAGDLSVNDVTLLTLQSQIENFIEALRVAFPLDEAPATTPVSTPDVQHIPQNAPLDDIAKTFDGATYTDRSEIRVETTKLDRLFDLMSELVTLQTMTLNNPDLHNLHLPNFQKSAAMLAKNIRQLQGVTMSMRMTPIEILFAKMKRVTREVATHVGKRVELKMSGADT